MAPMLHVLATPMGYVEPTLFGVPASMLSILVGVAGSIVSLLIVRRIAAGEGEYRSFRATRWRDPSTTLMGWVAVAVVFGALAVVGVVLALQPG